MNATSIPFLLGAVALSTLLPRAPQPSQNPRSITRDLAAIYTRYSRHLDTAWDGSGWQYAVPSPPYAETRRSSADNPRMQLTFASFYRFRHDLPAVAKVRAAFRNGVERFQKTPNAVTVNGQTVSTRSFHDTIGLYLALQIVRQRPTFLPPSEIRAAKASLQTTLPWALRGADTENRALIGAAYGLAALNDPLLDFPPDERTAYLELIRMKVQEGLRSLDAQYRYREGADRRFSLHYHLVVADLLAYLGTALNEPQWTETARQMLAYVRDAYPIGTISWRGSGRPTGIGLQTVLLRAIGEKYLGETAWTKYWERERTGRGFIDPDLPNRLVWRDDRDGGYNDDYSFVNMAELFWETLTN